TTDCQIGHVEALRGVVRVLAAQGEQVMELNAKPLLGVSTEVLLDESGRETVKARSHRRVGSEEIADSSRGERHFKGLAGLFHESAGAFQHGESRMAFIQVTNFRMDPERAEQPPAANPEKQFLFEAHLRPAAIQLTGDPSMSGIVRRVIAVQEVELDPASLDLPGAQPD